MIIKIAKFHPAYDEGYEGKKNATLLLYFDNLF